jgi:transcriptional regulator with XRE-family HTH domain
MGLAKRTMNRYGLVVANSEANEEPRRLGVVVGENLRRLRLGRGVSQAELAGLLTSFGSRWAKGRVVALETGTRDTVTVDELCELSNALRAPLAEFFIGDGEIPVGAHGTIEQSELRRALEFAEHVPVHMNSPEAIHAFQALVDEDYAAFEVAQQLDLPVQRVRLLARRLYGQNTTQERAARVGDLTDETEAAYRRRTVAKEMVREFQQAIDQEDQA